MKWKCFPIGYVIILTIFINNTAFIYPDELERKYLKFKDAFIIFTNMLGIEMRNNTYLPNVNHK